METKYNLNSPAVKRILREAKEFQTDPPVGFIAGPLEVDSWCLPNIYMIRTIYLSGTLPYEAHQIQILHVWIATVFISFGQRAFIMEGLFYQTIIRLSLRILCSLRYVYERRYVLTSTLAKRTFRSWQKDLLDRFSTSSRMLAAILEQYVFLAGVF